MNDDEIAELLACVDVSDTMMEFLADISGVEPEDTHPQTLRAMARKYGISVEDLLYSLFADDEPMFNDDTWKNLTSDE
jgi:hypothetical protein